MEICLVLTSLLHISMYKLEAWLQRFCPNFLIIMLSWILLGRISSNCRYEYAERQGVILSEGFPEDYPPNKMCEYAIIQPRGFYITINFTYFHFYPLRDMCDSAGVLGVRRKGYQGVKTLMFYTLQYVAYRTSHDGD